MNQKNRNIRMLARPISRRDFLKSGAGLAAAAAALPAAAANAADDGLLRVRAYTDLHSMDPAFSIGVTDEEIHAAVYSKLIQYRPGREWAWRKDAAAEIEQTDPTHIKFTLRDGLGFADGFGEMTAEDVKFSFERIVDPQLESTNKPDWGPLLRVEVTDKMSGVIVFGEPFSPVWSIALPYIAGNIVSKKAVESLEGSRINTQAIAASGPYTRKEWRPKERTVLARNPDYNGRRPVFDEIAIYPIDDEKAAERAFEAGELDFTRISLASLADLRANPPAGSAVDVYPSLYYAWVGVNLDNPKFADVRVRRAIQSAIDVPSIMEAAYFGEAEPSTGIIAPGLIGHRSAPLVAPAADADAARALLREAGVENLSVTLDILNKSGWVTAAQVIQANLAAVGIAVEVNIHEAGAFWTLGNESDGDRWKNVELILNRFSMTPDPYYATAWFTTEQVGVWNWERFRNPEFDRLHEAAKGEPDLQKRGEMYRRMQDLMEESGAYRFLTHEATPVIYRDGIRPALRPDGLALLRDFAAA